MINKDLLMEFFKDDDIKVVDKDFYIKSQMKRDVIKYITILEEENERLKEENILLKASEPMSKLAEDYGYKSRCEKAIELVNEMLERAYINGEYILYDYSTSEILEIKEALNGGDE